MKNLFYSVLFLFLFCSNAVYARTVISPKVPIRSLCDWRLGDLQKVANSAKDIQLVTNGCKNDRTEYQWKLKYIVTPTQNFKLEFPETGQLVLCQALAKNLNTRYSNDKVRFSAKCVDKESLRIVGVLNDGLIRWEKNSKVVLIGKMEVMTNSYAKKFKAGAEQVKRFKDEKECLLRERKLLKLFGYNKNIKIVTEGCYGNRLIYRFITRGSSGSTKGSISGAFYPHYRARISGLSMCNYMKDFLQNSSGINASVKCEIPDSSEDWSAKIKVKMKH